MSSKNALYSLYRDLPKLGNRADLDEQFSERIYAVIRERRICLSANKIRALSSARLLYYGREVLMFDEATIALVNERSLISDSAQTSG
ncbi:hypothetical protein C7B65_05475 [Phormidesmis priestleyi ULC007]|uniref:Uncharacterized protein n=1 Tax=Phormidesmis priestleyi ULC007 TaxID=1920490 RepID=A0A2T1DK41_9CYAN|nr:hypothetical protein [Phormidesmis priestleyi]PSB20860.1 hypothetical protein C7B65_05475 [Phormidesmis priestleyi ULC007]PZO51815.1 MAG: hypothetical protein DCF14_07620 [Phormidesmis priestleyi]